MSESLSRDALEFKDNLKKKGISGTFLQNDGTLEEFFSDCVNGVDSIIHLLFDKK